jgi:hypothetical protein
MSPEATKLALPALTLRGADVYGSHKGCRYKPVSTRGEDNPTYRGIL